MRVPAPQQTPPTAELRAGVGGRTYSDDVSPEPRPETETRKVNFDRVRLINTELDQLTIDANARDTSVMNKASFLAVSSGVLVAASTNQAWSQAAGFGIASLVLSCAGLACAAVALRPGKRVGVQAQRLVDRHLDCQHSAAEVERELIQEKALALALREPDLRDRGRWTLAGFGSVALAAASLTAVFSFEVAGG